MEVRAAPGSNGSSRLRMLSPSKAVCAETLAPKCPTILSKPMSNRDGLIRYRKGEALTARPGLACGTGCSSIPRARTVTPEPWLPRAHG
jgi:hypothetical protein